MPLKAERDRADGFTLLELLLAMCFVSPIAVALTPRPVVSRGFVGYAIGFTVGTLAGGLGAWGLYSAVGVLIARMPPSLDGKAWFSVLVLVGMLLWIVLVDIASAWTSASLLRFL